MGGPSTHAAKFLVAFALGLTATLAQAAGFRFIEVPAGSKLPFRITCRRLLHPSP
jgi:hypothetical protein